MGREPNPLLAEFLDASIPLPEVDWETVPPGVNPREVWEGYDECVEGWVPLWYPAFDSVTGRTYGEYERAHLFNGELERILSAMNRWPLWGSPRQKKHTVAFALLQLYCEVCCLCPRMESFPWRD
ncbi:MAG: hypothetical protein GX443_17945 [Deltaproteobacteria bacterium]|nr:hypothetical protein [Deltaproteobacteria bacterium]